MISFRLLKIPVTVRPSFLLIAALLGLSAARVSLVFAWIAVVFVSILLHEMGHALTARAFGSEVEIELNAIGGLTSWTVPEKEFGPGRRAVVAAAGSGVGVVFGGLVWLVASLTGPYFGLAGFVVNNLVYVNLFWGLLNWLPIRPLDGGHLFSSLLEKFAPRRGETIANVVFMITAAAGLTAALYFGLTFVALLAGWLLFGELTKGRPRRPQVPIPPMSFDRPPPDPEPEEVDG
ncbi:MAG TPA: site-2 protease family protein [Acidimicrobiia bacterium]|nr:site-2 protease family protein [Acidimicrobiia bacterium]